MSTQKSVLGKGLASLLPQVSVPAQPPAEQSQPASSSAPAVTQQGTGAIAAGPAVPAQANGQINNTGSHERHHAIALLAIDDVKVNQYQPRREFEEQPLEELAQSIRSNGIIQPLVVRKTATGYELIAGERRLRAAKKVGLKQVPVVIRRSTDKEALELALIENIQRENLNCVDEALAYQQLMTDFQLTQEEVAKRVGKERATVANFLRLLKLPEAVMDDLKRGILSLGHGKAIAGLEDMEQRLRCRAIVVERGMSVRDTEALVEKMKSGAAIEAAQQPAPTDKTLNPVQSRLLNISQELMRVYSTKAEVKGNERRGKITLYYHNRQELERLILQLGKTNA